MSRLKPLAGIALLGSLLILFAVGLNYAASDRSDLSNVSRAGSAICKDDSLVASFPICGPVCPAGSRRAAYKITTRQICLNELQPGCDRIWFFGWNKNFDDSYCAQRGYDGTIRADLAGMRSATGVGGLCYMGRREACVASIGPDAPGIQPASHFR